MTIGLTYTGAKEKHGNYVRWLLHNDRSIHIVTLSAETNESTGLVEDCDAFVLSGGVDTHPGYYNSDNLVYPNMPKQFNEKRDAFEQSVFKYAQKNKKPVLGVCRGLQLINCILGGNLKQDLGAKNTVHKAIVNEKGRQFDKAHGLHIVSGTLLEQIAGNDRSLVNSAHHQCVDTIAGELISSCVSDDDIVEGLEWKEKSGKPFLLCVQWHPERMFEFQLEHAPLSAGIRKIFLEAVQNKQPIK